MKSLISEFSYGFALTHELVISLGSLSAAPIFPSLLEEGKAGGGYDVNLNAPGLPIFIQFKRSDCLTTNNAREIKAGANLTTPYYRFEITAKADSAQHDMLLDLDTAPNLVFYAAPMFHEKAKFDAAFLSGTIRQNSFFIRPQIIGSFMDDRAHHVSFDGKTCVVMSEPKQVEALGVAELEQLLADMLKEQKQPLRSAIGEAIKEAEKARERSRARIPAKTDQPEFPVGSVSENEVEAQDADETEAFRQRQEDAIPPAIATDESASTEHSSLRKLADIGLREFNAQLYIVQETTKLDRAAAAKAEN